SSNEGSGIQSSHAEKAAQNIPKEEFERKVKEIIRLALTSELRKVPLKRDEIIRKVLKEHSRSFPVILSKAQERLRDIFGMDLVELPVKDKRVNIGSNAPRRNAQVKEKSSSNSYILKNILPKKLLETDLINWDKNKDLEVMGLLTVVLSLILVNGRVLSDGRYYFHQLNNYTRRLHLHNDERFDLEKLIANFVKQGYLVKQKVSVVENPSQTSDKDPVEYRWGPRAKIEMPESNLCDFIKAVYGNDAPPDLEKRIERASGIE
ncbi:736_t:CDS:2, partial [Acaulospora morrowiae]